MDKRAQRWLVRGAQGVTLTALVAGTAAFVSSDKTVQLSVDGADSSVKTFGSTVGDALRAAGVHVDEHDAVSPSLDAPITDGSTVRVQLARDVTVVVDGSERTVQTTATTAGELADQLGVDAGSKLSLGDDVELAASSTRLAVTTPKTIFLDRAGRTTTVTTTALDVEALLREQGIEPDADDTVSPARNTVLRDGQDVEWVQLSTKKERQKSTLEHMIQETEDPDLLVGTKKVTSAGRDGSQRTDFEVTYRNGQEVARKKVSTKVTAEPVAELVSVGTKTKAQAKAEAEKEAKEQAAKAAKEKAAEEKAEEKNGTSEKKSSSPSSGGGTTSTGGVSGVWTKLAKCESGGNWGINTGNGYYGGLQFTKSTWDAMGGGKYAAYPHQASAAEQVAVASKLQARAGWGQWPACTRKLGLR